jgi:hypothetical protein
MSEDSVLSDPWISCSLDLEPLIYELIDHFMDPFIDQRQLINQSINPVSQCVWCARCHLTHHCPTLHTTAQSTNPIDPLIHWSMNCSILYCCSVCWLLLVFVVRASVSFVMLLLIRQSITEILIPFGSPGQTLRLEDCQIFVCHYSCDPTTRTLATVRPV